MMPKLLLLVVAAGLLSACQQMPVQDEASQYSRISPGSRIVLNKDLTVPAGHARVFIQNGAVSDKSQLDRYNPHCNFEIQSVSDGTRQILAGTFLVTAVSTGEELVVQTASPYYRVSFNPGLDRPLSMIAPFVHHRLHSDTQPEVMRLTCHGGFAQPWWARYPSVSEIRKALGNVATVDRVGLGGR